MEGTSPVPEPQRWFPAASLSAGRLEQLATLPPSWPHEVAPDWAWGGSRGAGARVCVLDSGVERDHPRVGGLEQSVAVAIDEDGNGSVEDSDGDLSGHGTACAGIVRTIAPECAISSVRVLGVGSKGSGTALLAGLRWAVDQRFDVINMSLSTTKRRLAETLHELADDAYFRRTVLVVSAHNVVAESYPWRFSSVVSVGSHEQPDPLLFVYNPTPPVEFYARGVDVDVAWSGGGTARTSGNSFATPHLAGICALILAKHPELTPFQLKTVLFLTAANVRGERQ